MQKKPIASQKQPVSARTRATRQAVRSTKSRGGRSSGDLLGNQLAWLIGGGIVVLVVLLVAIGYYNENIGPAHDTAIVVGNNETSLGYFRDRLKAATVDGGDATQSGAQSKVLTTSDAIEEEQVYLQRAGSLGVTASEKDITLQLAQMVHAATQNGQVADQAGYLSLLRLQLQRNGLSLDQYREMAKAAALKSNLLAKLKAGVPSKTLAVKLHELIFTSEDQARAAQKRLEQGDAFTYIEQDSVADTSIGRAQPIDWTLVPFGILPAPVDIVAANLQPGQVSDVLKVDAPTPSGPDSSASSGPQWMLVTVTDRDSQHDVSDTQATQIANKKQADWLAAEKEALRVHSLLDQTKLKWAIDHLGLPAQAAPSPTAKSNLPGVVPSTGPGAPVGPPAPAGSAPAGGPPVPGTNNVPPVPGGSP